MARYSRKDGGEVNTDYRGRRVDVGKDGTIFVGPPSRSTPTTRPKRRKK